jgi:hypothetical protein
MEAPIGKLSLFLSAKDEVDSKILFDTANMIAGLNIDNFVFRNKQEWEEYFGNVIDLTQSLLKANDYRREYIEKELKTLREQEDKFLKDPNKNVYLEFNPIGLNSEIDGFLSQIKAALDSLAKTLNPLFGFKLNGWRKDKKLSGGKIIKSLKNLPAESEKFTQPLQDFINKNVGWVSYLVFLRDSPHHHGGIKSISGIMFDTNSKKITPQQIYHAENHVEDINAFLTRTINEIDQFVNSVLILSLIAKIPSLAIVKNTQSNWPPYQWAMILPNQPEINKTIGT